VGGREPDRGRRHHQSGGALVGHNVARAVLFRHRDADLARRAAQTIHARVEAAQNGRTPPIAYDFSMRLNNGYRRLFCSKLIRQAFDEASRGEVLLPTFKTGLHKENRDFFRRIGVRARETFAPGDIELEPDFQLLAEWRNPRETSSLRLQDFLLDTLFEWMEKHKYRFKGDLSIWLIGIFGRLASHLSNSAKELMHSVVPKVPTNMKRRSIQAVAMLHATAQPLLAELKVLEQLSTGNKAVPLSAAEVLAHLERKRQEAKGRIGYLRAP
jgi:hypothetical protein